MLFAAEGGRAMLVELSHEHPGQLKLGNGLHVRKTTS
jgi:hypothetical protein